MENSFNPVTVAIFLARVLLGVLFFIQGYDKIFSIGIRSVIRTIEPAYRKIRLPHFIVVIAAFFTSFTELLGGLLLILGLLKYTALYLLGIDLLIVAIGMSLINPVWKMDIVFPRFMLLIFLLIMPDIYDVWALHRIF